jgi:HlyD family secretion protein
VIDLSASGKDQASILGTAIRRHIVVGWVGSGAMIVALAAMATMIDFAGAIIAPGRVVVDSSVKKVQPAATGTIVAIHVKDGDRVRVGDLLIELDAKTAEANLRDYTQQIDALRARQARLKAETTGAASIAFPLDLLGRRGDAEVEQLIVSENEEFTSGRAAREGQKDQLRKKISELQQQLAGDKAQEDATRQQIALIQKDLKSFETLNAQGLIGDNQLDAVKRQAAQFDGQLGQLVSAEGLVGAQIAEASLQILQVDSDMRNSDARDLTDGEAKLNDLTQRAIAARDELSNLQIRAPQDGTIYQLAVQAVGSAIQPGQTLMMIVPSNDLLDVDARIDPSNIDRLNVGSEARLRFVTLGARTTPEFSTTIDTISPDVIVDDRTGASYYLARMRVPPAAVAAIGRSLVPGMPVEVMVGTGQRSALSYLVKPLADQITYMFRER